MSCLTFSLSGELPLCQNQTPGISVNVADLVHRQGSQRTHKDELPRMHFPECTAATVKTEVPS